MRCHSWCRQALHSFCLHTCWCPLSEISFSSFYWVCVTSEGRNFVCLVYSHIHSSIYLANTYWINKYIQDPFPTWYLLGSLSGLLQSELLLLFPLLLHCAFFCSVILLELCVHVTYNRLGESPSVFLICAFWALKSPDLSRFLENVCGANGWWTANPRTNISESTVLWHVCYYQVSLP